MYVMNPQMLDTRKTNTTYSPTWALTLPRHVKHGVKLLVQTLSELFKQSVIVMTQGNDS